VLSAWGAQLDGPAMPREENLVDAGLSSIARTIGDRLSACGETVWAAGAGLVRLTSRISGLRPGSSGVLSADRVRFPAAPAPELTEISLASSRAAWCDSVRVIPHPRPAPV
jgi:hypothetical protein